MTEICPVCGYDGLNEPPRFPKSGGASHEICPSCGYQFGFTDDALEITYDEWRKRWIEGGMIWDKGTSIPPKNWNPEEQLKNLEEQNAESKKYSNLTTAYMKLLNRRKFPISDKEKKISHQILNEACNAYGDEDFPFTVGSRAKGRLLMDKLRANFDNQEPFLASTKEIAIITFAIKEVLREIEEWEMQTRTGYTKIEIEDFLRKIDST